MAGCHTNHYATEAAGGCETSAYLNALSKEMLHCSKATSMQ